MRHQQRTQTEIYAAVMHGICRPLAAISMIIAMIKLELGGSQGSVPAPMVKRLEQANPQAARCIEISRRYVQSSKVQSARSPSVRVNQVINGIQEFVAISPLSKGHPFTVTLLPHGVLAPIHGTDLVQILLNLFNNALQATKPPHPVALSVEYQIAPLDLSRFVDGPAERLIHRENFTGQPPLLALCVCATTGRASCRACCRTCLKPTSPPRILMREQVWV